MDSSNLEEQGTIDPAMMKAGTCGRCHMLVARYAPQVIAAGGIYHRECYEAWYFGRYGRRPSLTAGPNGDRHRFQVAAHDHAIALAGATGAYRALRDAARG